MAIYTEESLPSDWKEAIENTKNINGSELASNLTRINLEKIDAGSIVKYGQIIGYKAFSEKLKYSQLRRYVDEIKSFENLENIEQKISQIKLLRIALLHGYSRQSEKMKTFYDFIDTIIKADKIKSEDDFVCFLKLIDSITAHFEALND